MNCFWNILVGIWDANDEENNGQHHNLVVTPPLHPDALFQQWCHRISTNDPDLKHVSLDDSEVLVNHFATFRAALVQNSQIQVLEIVQRTRSGRLQKIMDGLFPSGKPGLLPHCNLPTSIVELKFCRCRVGGKALKSVLASFQGLQHLQVLDFSHGAVDDQVLSMVAAQFDLQLPRNSQRCYCPHLQELRVAHNHLSDEEAFGRFVHVLVDGSWPCPLKRIFAKGNGFASATKLVIALGEKIRSSIEILDLSQSQLEFVTIANGFPSLVELQMNYCSGCGTSGADWAGQVSFSPSLKVLSLRECNLNICDANNLVTALLSGRIVLDVLDLGGNNDIETKWLFQLFSKAEICSALTIPRSGSRKGEDVLAALCESPHTTELRQLHFTHSSLAESAKRNIALWLQLNELGLAPRDLTVLCSPFWESLCHQHDSFSREDYLFQKFRYYPSIALKTKWHLD